jgi:hypothetical protein
VPPQIDYALARRATLRDVKLGRVDRVDVCDAHPDLLRAARNLGRETVDTCPVCAAPGLRTVSYVYGDKLREANGRPVASDAELERLGARHDEFRLYVVEVCLACAWNYLVRTFLLGRRHAV